MASSLEQLIEEWTRRADAAPPGRQTTIMREFIKDLKYTMIVMQAEEVRRGTVLAKP